MFLFAHFLHWGYVIELSAQITAGPLVILISLIWLVFFVKLAKRNYKQWGVFRFEGEGMKRKIYFHKYALILTLLISDIIVCVASLVETTSYFIKDRDWSELSTKDCNITEHTWLATIVFERHHSSSILEGVWQSAVLAEFCIFISILKYFETIYRESLRAHWQKPDYSLKEENLKYLVIMVPQTVLLLIFDATPIFIMGGQLVFVILAFIYWCITVHSAKQLNLVLGWYKADMIHEISSQQQQDSVYNLKLYRSSIICLLFASALFIMAELAYTVSNVWVGTIMLNSCWFRSQYGIGPEINVSRETSYNYKYVTYSIILLRNFTVLIFLISVLVLNFCFALAEYNQRKKLDKFIREKRSTESLRKPLI